MNVVRLQWGALITSGVLASLAGATWQMANPGTALAELYASDPSLARACIDLTARLRRSGAELVHRARSAP